MTLKGRFCLTTDQTHKSSSSKNKYHSSHQIFFPDIWIYATLIQQKMSCKCFWQSLMPLHIHAHLIAIYFVACRHFWKRFAYSSSLTSKNNPSVLASWDLNNQSFQLTSPRSRRFPNSVSKMFPKNSFQKVSKMVGFQNSAGFQIVEFWKKM